MASWKRTKCSIIHCEAAKTLRLDIKLFDFPKKDTTKYTQWLSLLGESQEHVKSLKRPYICSKHFEKALIGKKYLRKNAYPSLYLTRSEEVCISDSESVNFDPSKAKITYEKRNEADMSNNDLDAEELSRASKRLSAKKSNEEIEFTCTNCEAHLKRQLYYIKSIGKLKKENRALKIKIQTNRKSKINMLQKISRFKKTKKRLRSDEKNSLEREIDLMEGINRNTKTFAKLILSQTLREYTNEEKWITQCIFFRSSCGYNFLRDQLGLHLPNPSSLHRWINIKSLSPGPNIKVLEEIRNVTSSLSEKDREVNLIFDEMSLQTNLTYNKFKDEIEGFVDYGKNQRSSILAKSACVFMIRSVCGNFKQVLYHVVCPSNIPMKQLEIEVHNCLDICTGLNLNVRAICCDQGPTNRSLFNKLNLDERKFSFMYKEKEIYGMYDIPHLIKSIRNNLLKYNFSTSDGIVSWKVIKYLYNSEKCNTTKICPRLTSAHIDPTEFQKMSVKLAAQILSRSVACGIEALNKLGKFPAEINQFSKSTAEFIKKINRLFDLLNGKPALIRNDQNILFIKEMKLYLLNIELINARNRPFCFKGLALTIESILCIREALFKEYNDLYHVYVNKFNQDPLENLFGKIRARNVNKSNPSVSEFGALLAKVISLKFLFNSKCSNCEEDDTEYLQVDWKAILQSDTEDKSKEQPQIEEMFDVTECIENDINVSNVEYNQAKDATIVKVPEINDLGEISKKSKKIRIMLVLDNQDDEENVEERDANTEQRMKYLDLMASSDVAASTAAGKDGMMKEIDANLLIQVRSGSI
ncbi:uncharacterized protein LOC129950754 [Eupeodes corollae]|uniref:uncharacterized protein LOC129950754 n=1 Tax=Eupeodes corollae TaxID=290404 RepID=UPI00248FBB1C|nr:uncharacterized protein LOC129950754 [Eupeodes corollae]